MTSDRFSCQDLLSLSGGGSSGVHDKSLVPVGNILHGEHSSFTLPHV